jgi:GrpB-like predicted nucleotidyltransferase (UPF0157 family)
MPITAYIHNDAEFRGYNPVFKTVAQRLRELIQNAEPRLTIEHIGSTSVPGCSGKGIIDLAVLYPEGLLARARNVLDELGFQKQGGPEPFPEERPMRVGAIEHEGRGYYIHVHVIALNCAEHQELIWFREALTRDSVLREHYEDRKRSILKAGVRDSLEYCKAKGDFITSALKAHVT